MKSHYIVTFGLVLCNLAVAMDNTQRACPNSIKDNLYLFKEIICNNRIWKKEKNNEYLLPRAYETWEGDLYSALEIKEVLQQHDKKDKNTPYALEIVFENIKECITRPVEVNNKQQIIKIFKGKTITVPFLHSAMCQNVKLDMYVALCLDQQEVPQARIVFGTYQDDTSKNMVSNILETSLWSVADENNLDTEKINEFNKRVAYFENMPVESRPHSEIEYIAKGKQELASCYHAIELTKANEVTLQTIGRFLAELDCKKMNFRSVGRVETDGFYNRKWLSLQN